MSKIKEYKIECYKNKEEAIFEAEELSIKDYDAIGLASSGLNREFPFCILFKKEEK